MDRPKALALSVSLTGVIAAATAALALNLGLIHPGATTPAAPTAAVAASPTAAARPTPSRPSYGEGHESDDDAVRLSTVSGGEQDD